MPDNAISAPDAKSTPMVRCPSCGEQHPYRRDNPYRPFCSRGCQAIDLGAWASEQYRVEAKSSGDGSADHQDQDHSAPP